MYMALRSLVSLLPLIGSGALEDGFPSGIASSCSQLRHLEIRGGRLGAVPEVLGRLTALTRLMLTSTRVTSLPASISRLAGLRELGITFNPQLRLLLGLTACRGLTQLSLDYYIESPVLTQLTALRDLHLQCSLRGKRAPAPLGDITWLRSMHITGAWLAEMPAGQYLGSITSLRIDTFHVPPLSAWVPASLAAATQLRSLTVDECLGLAYPDVAVLSALPALESFQMVPPLFR